MDKQFLNDRQAGLMKDWEEGVVRKRRGVALKTHMQSVYVVLQSCTEQ